MSSYSVPSYRYRGREVRGPGVHPPSGGSAHPHPDPHTMSAAMAAAPSESRALSQRLTERIESWFGSVEQFSDKVVYGVRFAIVDCLTYPYTVFSRQCQIYPYNLATPSLAAPLSTAMVLHQIAQTQGVYAFWRGWYSHLALLIARPFTSAVIRGIGKRVAVQCEL